MISLILNFPDPSFSRNVKKLIQVCTQFRCIISPFSSTPPSVQHVSSTQMGHFFSAPKIPQFHTKNPSVQQNRQFHTKNPQFNKTVSSIPKTPQLNTKKSSVQHTPQTKK